MLAGRRRPHRSVIVLFDLSLRLAALWGSQSWLRPAFSRPLAGASPANSRACPPTRSQKSSHLGSFPIFPNTGENQKVGYA
uniref:Uncharacterized protein n=1 Tax=Solibacter usitatus (strain Ellin6076) TaxID=234267 RepID=Q027I7_SOLUE